MRGLDRIRQGTTSSDVNHGMRFDHDHRGAMLLSDDRDKGHGLTHQGAKLSNGISRRHAIRGLGVLLLFALLGPSLAAAGATEFEIVFPQDATVTIFTSSFGADRDGGDRKHQGNDLMAPKMTPVYAVADGVVSRIKTGGRSGWYIMVDHGNGWESFHMHLNNDTPGTDDNRAAHEDTFAEGIEIGSEVIAGQLIGYVGDSGNAEGTAPHIHFELHRNGRPVDPYPYLYPAYKAAVSATATEVLPLVADLFTGLGSTPMSRATPQT